MAAITRDTSSEAAAVQRRIINAKSLDQRTQMLDALCDGVAQIALAGIRKQHPDASEGDVMILLMERRYGREFMGSLPATAIDAIKDAQLR